MLIHTLFLPFLCSTKPSLVIEYLSGQIQMTFTNENYDRLGLISFFRFADLANLGCIYYEACSNRKTTHF